MEYILYCDESTGKGRYYSDFYGGVLVNLSDFDEIRSVLEDQKIKFGLFGEIKWTKVTAYYLDKYIRIIDKFFDYFEAGKLRMRVMFRQSAIIAANLTQEQKRGHYHLLYYQFIKHAFGFRYCNPGHNSDVFLRVYFDKIPDTKIQNEEFKAHILGLQSLKSFRLARVKIRQDDIVEIDSKDHVIQQCMDIVLGSMSFRLNNMHLERNQEIGIIGKKTKAKEKLYKHCLSRIRRLDHPDFNIGITTSEQTPTDRWTDSYRHWNFVPSEFVEDKTRYKHR